jgi:hypothetical protein
LVCDHENVPKNEKLTLFLDYYVQQLMVNPTEMWKNINKYQQRTSSAIEGWDFKPCRKSNSLMGFPGTKIKRRSRAVILATGIKASWTP